MGIEALASGGEATVLTVRTQESEVVSQTAEELMETLAYWTTNFLNDSKKKTSSGQRVRTTPKNRPKGAPLPTSGLGVVHNSENVVRPELIEIFR
jgi:hypothetical protein